MYVDELVHDALAEKFAVTVQFAPLAVNPEKLYARGEANGALNVCVPPHGEETVSVPLVGGFTKLIEPDTEYKSFAQAEGVAVTEEIEQLHDDGAV